MTHTKFIYIHELKNYVNENILKAIKNKFGIYIITETNNELIYHKSLADCARVNGIGKGTLSKHHEMTR